MPSLSLDPKGPAASLPLAHDPRTRDRYDILMSAFELPPLSAGDARPGSSRESAAIRIGQLYEQHHRMVRALCQLLLRNPVDADDAVQQTFLCALGSLIDGTVPELPGAWLATIARRECWARGARRKRQPLTLDETTAPLSETNPLDEAIRNADLTALWAAINDLPRQQRKAFLMREFSGLSYAEIAEALGASESAIESLLVRARRQVRDGLAPVLRTANLVTTPVVLLYHRWQRLSGDHNACVGSGAGAGAAATTAAVPVAAKVAAAVVGVVAVGSAGAKIAPHVAALRHSAVQPAVAAPSPRSVTGGRSRPSFVYRLVTAPSPLRRRPATAATGQAFPLGVRRRPGRTPIEVPGGRSGAADGAAVGASATRIAAGDTPEATTTPAAAGAAPGSEPLAAPGTETTAAATHDAAPTATAGEHTAQPEPSPIVMTQTATTGEHTAHPDPSPTETAATETTGEDTAPADASSTDTTRADWTSAETDPVDATSETTSVDTRSADTASADANSADQSASDADPSDTEP